MSLRHAVAALAAAVVALALPACAGESVEDATVVLADVRDAYVVSGGSQRPAADGDELAKNDQVRTRAGGTATLVVRDRKVVLGGETGVVVPDGATVELDGGALLVDRRRGPGLTVRAGDTVVDEIGEGALRVERSLSVLVAGLSAGARVRTVTGAALDLPALYQVVAPGRSLPKTGLPLQLRADAWERSVIADLVTEDQRLNDLVRGLVAPGPPVIPAAYRRPNVVEAGDLVLADAIGRAAADDENGRRNAASRARLLRGEGGSWGVVARLLDTSAVDVGSALGEVLAGVPVAAPGPVGGTPGTPAPVANGSPQPGVTPSPGPSSPRPTSPGPTTRTPSKPPTSSGSPSETPDPLDEIVSSIPTPPPLLPLDLLAPSPSGTPAR